MGWITFEDGIAYSRNVVAAKVALRLGDTTRDASAALYDEWRRLGFGEPTGMDLAGEVSGLVRDPGLQPWSQIDLANGAFGQGVAVTPIQLATAYAALLNGGRLVQPHVVQSVGDIERLIDPGARVVEPAVSDQLRALADHVIDEVPFYRDRTLRPRLSRRRQDRDRPDLGCREGPLEAQPLQLLVRRIHRPGKRTCPTSSSRSASRRARRPIARVGQLEMPVMSFELFRRIATNAITTPDLLKDRRIPALDRRERPVTRWPCHTGRRDRRRDADRGTGRRIERGGGPVLRADDLVR